MLKRYMELLLKEYEIEDSFEDPKRPGSYNFPVTEELSATISEDNGLIFFDAELAPTPEKNAEEFYARCLQASLFGQDTMGATLALDGTGKRLTLSRAIDYNVDYEQFKQVIEDFLNALEMWNAEVEAEAA